MDRAKETSNEVGELIKLEFYFTAVNRIYYSCFYAINALLLKSKIASRTHSGVRRMFGLHFTQTGN
jgi:uncharacterized protein (UPF0332 family)